MWASVPDVLRNGPSGYGSLTKVLHWATVVGVAAQFVVGYTMDLDDSGRGRGRGSGGDDGGSGRGRGRGGDTGYEVLDDRLATIHVALGVFIVLLVLVRLLWRRVGTLPPWSEALSEAERRLAHWTERLLLGSLVVVPVTGVVLVLGGDDDLLWLHVTAHVAFFCALAAHLWTNLPPRVLRRML